jgi:hypothetical protein
MWASLARSGRDIGSPQASPCRGWWWARMSVRRGSRVWGCTGVADRPVDRLTGPTGAERRGEADAVPVEQRQAPRCRARPTRRCSCSRAAGGRRLPGPCEDVLRGAGLQRPRRIRHRWLDGAASRGRVTSTAAELGAAASTRRRCFRVLRSTDEKGSSSRSTPGSRRWCGPRRRCCWPPTVRAGNAIRGRPRGRARGASPGACWRAAGGAAPPTFWGG